MFSHNRASYSRSQVKSYIEQNGSFQVHENLKKHFQQKGGNIIPLGKLVLIYDDYDERIFKKSGDRTMVYQLYTSTGESLFIEKDYHSRRIQLISEKDEIFSMLIPLNDEEIKDL